MKRLCFFAIAALLAAGCSKEAVPTGDRSTDVIRVGNGSGTLEISLNPDNENTPSKSSNDDYERINTCYIVVGTYENGVYGSPIINRAVNKKFTLIGLEEGEVYIAAIVNPEEEPQSPISSLEEFNSGKWTLKNFTGAKSGMAYATIVKNSTAKAKVELKRCYGTIYISKLVADCSAVLDNITHRWIYLDEIYLQNIPAFSSGYLWGWEEGMPSASSSGENNWFNPSETIGMSSDSFINGLTSWKANDKYTSTAQYQTFFCPPNTTSRKTRLVIKAHYNDYDSDTYHTDCYYTLDLPQIKPNTKINFKSIILSGLGEESPNEYKGQSNINYTMTVDNWDSGSSVTENF